MAAGHGKLERELKKVGRQAKWGIIAPTIIAIVIASVCGWYILGILGPPSAPGAPSAPGPPSGVFYTATANVTPVFAPSSTKVFAAQGSDETSYPWGSGNAVYSVFYTLREFLPERDEGIVDRSNMYKLLYDVDTLLEGAKGEGAEGEVAEGEGAEGEVAEGEGAEGEVAEESVVPLPTPSVITPPYNFGNNKTYNKAANNENREWGVAITETDTTIDAVVGWIWRDPTNPEKMETGVFEASLNKSTNNVTVDFVFSVDYDISDPTTDYNMRVKLSGNTATHAFEFRFVMGGASESDGLTQIVGKGVSRGEGNKFLFKVKTNLNDNRFFSPRYLVLDATANEDSLKVIDVESETYTDPNNLPTEVSDYKDYVVNTPFFEHTDLLVNRNDLNQGNPKAGTIYLNY